MNKRILIVGICLVFIQACAIHPGGDGPGKNINPDDIKQPIPKKLEYSRYGNPKKYTVFGKTYFVKDSHLGYNQTGMGSWYGTQFHGKKTSTQETYNMYAMTAAHKTLPIPCYAEVTNLDNGKKVIVKINDRGPFHEGRIIDLSYAAAAKLDYLKKGTARVRVRTIDANQVRAQSPNSKKVDKSLQPGQYYYVQVGAYSQDSSVDLMLTRLRAARISPINSTMRRRGETLSKVRVGPLRDPQIVAQVMDRLDDAGIYPYKLVIE